MHVQKYSCQVLFGAFELLSLYKNDFIESVTAEVYVASNRSFAKVAKGHLSFLPTHGFF